MDLILDIYVLIILCVWYIVLSYMQYWVEYY